MNRRRPHLNGLTSLRFVAAITIFILHARNHDLIPDSILSSFDLSKSVSLFFVLSGFVISYAYSNRNASFFNLFVQGLLAFGLQLCCQSFLYSFCYPVIYTSQLLTVVGQHRPFYFSVCLASKRGYQYPLFSFHLMLFFGAFLLNYFFTYVSLSFVSFPLGSYWLYLFFYLQRYFQWHSCLTISNLLHLD